MSLRECMEKHTEKEMRVTLAWLEMQWDRPSRTDWYLMQVAAEVRRGLVKKPNSVKTGDLKIKFVLSSKHSAPALTPEQQMMHSKHCWMGAVGLLGKVKLWG
jgi:ADP-glucose pyrophosphorylase